MLEVGVPLRRAQRYYVRKEFKDDTLYLSKQSKDLFVLWRVSVV